MLGHALDGLKDVATVERPPAMEGRFLSVILTPTAKKPEKAKSEEQREDEPVGEVQD